MKLYRYLTGPDDSAFCLRVTEALNKGWSLHGGPTLAFNGTHMVAGQAIVKEVEGEFHPGIVLRDM